MLRLVIRDTRSSFTRDTHNATVSSPMYPVLGGILLKCCFLRCVGSGISVAHVNGDQILLRVHGKLGKNLSGECFQRHGQVDVYGSSSWYIDPSHFICWFFWHRESKLARKNVLLPSTQTRRKPRGRRTRPKLKNSHLRSEVLLHRHCRRLKN